jgi:excisionase family DNA binding protein
MQEMTETELEAFAQKIAKQVTEALYKKLIVKQKAAELLTIKEVAEVLKISKPSVHSLIAHRKLGAIKLDGQKRWLIERKEVEAFIVRSQKKTLGDYFPRQKWIPKAPTHL